MDGITYSNALASMAPTVSVVKPDPVTLANSDSSKTQAPDANETAPYAVAINKAKYELSYSEEQIIKAVEKANRAIVGPPKKFEYSVHKPTGDIVVKVVNSDTNEVLKEIPPEKLLDIVDGIADTTGVIIDEKR